jgi:hypothetical protein
MPSDIPTDIFSADFGAIAERNTVSGTSATFTWTTKAGVATVGLVGILSPVSRTQKDVDPGFIAEFDATMEVGEDQFTSPAFPARGDRFTVGSDVFQIMDFTTEPSAAVRIYKLNSINV